VLRSSGTHLDHARRLLGLCSVVGCRKSFAGGGEGVRQAEALANKTEAVRVGRVEVWRKHLGVLCDGQGSEYATTRIVEYDERERQLLLAYQCEGGKVM